MNMRKMFFETVATITKPDGTKRREPWYLPATDGLAAEEMAKRLAEEFREMGNEVEYERLRPAFNENEEYCWLEE